MINLSGTYIKKLVKVPKIYCYLIPACSKRRSIISLLLNSRICQAR